MKYIRDPLYGNLTISDAEQAVIDTPQFQRLRRLDQLGLSSLIYPAATHTRFEHSLGVMHLSGELAKAINLPEEEVQAYRFAGLLHDIGHGPFSHASEILIEERTGKPHEEYSCELVDSLAEKIPVETTHIKEIIRGESDYNIVNGTIDADRMDYLRRDASRTGVEHGTIDTNTILQFATISNDKLAFDKKAVPALESLLTARFHMNTSVYNHHTSRIAESMLHNSLEDYVNRNSITDIIYKDDYDMHTQLSTAGGVAQELYLRLQNRNLYKTVFERGVGEEFSKQKLQEIEDMFNEIDIETEIAEAANCDPKYVLFDKPTTPTEKTVDVPIIYSNTRKDFSEVSPMPEILYESEWENSMIRVYAPEDKREMVKEAAHTTIHSYLEY